MAATVRSCPPVTLASGPHRPVLSAISQPRYHSMRPPSHKEFNSIVRSSDQLDQTPKTSWNGMPSSSGPLSPSGTARSIVSKSASQRNTPTNHPPWSLSAECSTQTFTTTGVFVSTSYKKPGRPSMTSPPYSHPSNRCCRIPTPTARPMQRLLSFSPMTGASTIDEWLRSLNRAGNGTLNWTRRRTSEDDDNNDDDK
jgi:hypothetical protein